MKTVLAVLPSTSYRSADLIEAAERIGVDVVAVSNRHQTLADLRGNRFISTPFTDPDRAATAVMDALRESGVTIDAVVPIDDGGVMIAAVVATALGLPHNPVASVAATRDKALMRQVLDTADITQPQWNIADLFGFAHRIGYPVVAKPVGLSGSRGVIRCDDDEQLAEAVKTIREIASDDHPIIVEEFIRGPEISIDGAVGDDGFVAVGVMDKPDPLDGPTFEETLFVMPSRHDPATVQAAIDLTARSVEAIGLVRGPVHAELRLAKTGPVMIELAARPIGGLCGRAMQFSVLGRSLEELLLRNALNLPLGDTSSLATASGVAMLPIPAGGIVAGYNGIDIAESTPHITGVSITANAGSRIEPLPHAERYAGFVFARATSADEVELALRTAVEAIEIVLEQS